MSKKLLDQIYNEATPKVLELGYDLVDVDFIKEGANWYLRFFIDKEPKVEIEDCAKTSEMLSQWLDETDPISQAYFLEVSSPGIERVLRRDKDFIRFAGSKVAVRLFGPWEGKKQFKGKLGPVDEQVLHLENDEGQNIQIPRDKIARINLIWEGF